MALIASACTGGGGSEKEGLPAGHGDTLRVVFAAGGIGPADDYDPQIAGSEGALGLGRCCLFRTLLSYNGRPTEEGGTTPRPDLAAGPPRVSEDGLTWTFHLKTGIRYAPPFEDREVVAQDIIRGLRRALAPLSGKAAKLICGGPPCQLMNVESHLYLSLIEGAQEYADGKAKAISGLQAPDPHTVRVRLTRPSGTVAYLFAASMASPIPPKPGDPTAPFGAAQGHTLDYGRGFAVSSGPYMVGGSGGVDYALSADRQEPASGVGPSSTTLVRNPSWDPATDDLRVAYPDRIVIRGCSASCGFQKTINAGERLVAKDRADLVGDVTAPAPLVERFRNSLRLRDRVHIGPLQAVTVLAMNTAIPPFDNLHVRRALNFAIDKVALQPFLARYTSLGEPANHIGYDSFEDNLLVDYAPYGRGSGNLGAAKDEMARSRYDGDGDRRCDARVCRGVTLVYPSTEQSMAHMAPVIKGDLAPLGIRVSVHPEPLQKWIASLTDPSSHVPLNLLYYIGGNPTGSDFYPTIFQSDALTGPSIGNPTLLGASSEQLRKWGYPVSSVPNVDDRIAECDQQIFRPQVECWASFDQYLTERVSPWVPLLTWTGAVLVSSRVQRFSWDQSIQAPALDRIQLKTGSR